MHITIVLDHFHIIPIVCSVKPEDHPKIVTPVVAIVIKKLLQLPDSLADHPVRIEFKVNQVNFTCELATALHAYWQLMLSVQYVTWDVDQSCTHVHVYTFILHCVYMRNLCWRRFKS